MVGNLPSAPPSKARPSLHLTAEGAQTDRGREGGKGWVFGITDSGAPNLRLGLHGAWSDPNPARNSTLHRAGERSPTGAGVERIRLSNVSIPARAGSEHQRRPKSLRYFLYGTWLPGIWGLTRCCIKRHADCREPSQRQVGTRPARVPDRSRAWQRSQGWPAAGFSRVEGRPQFRCDTSAETCRSPGSS